MVVMVCTVGEVRPALAQALTPAHDAGRRGEILGTVSDDHGRPLAGAVVSAVGTTSAFAVTDASGRYGFRALVPGPYLVRAHLEGYSPAAATLIQVNSGARSTFAIKLTAPGTTKVLSAGVGGASAPAQGSATAAPDDPANDNHSALAWRLRHVRRGVLNDAETTLVDPDDHDSFFQDSLESVSRAVAASARLASAVLSDLSGELNLLTSTSFDRPQQLFASGGDVPHGVAHLTLESPGTRGDWALRGALTQGDLSSWLLAGSYARHAVSTHAYEAGVSYTMQRYVGGNAVALAAVADGRRTAGTIFAYDKWHVAPAVTVEYGGKYARYGYLESDLFSPRVAMTVKAGRAWRLRAAASRRERAPGAEEFQAPSAIGLWLPPERTFSTLKATGAFVPERVAHYEVAGERDLAGGWTVGGRAFRQRVDDQMVTLFGVSLPHSPASDIGHYHVASAGNVNGQGWGVSVSRTIAGNIHGSLDYTTTRAHWLTGATDLDVLSRIAPGFLRQARERLYDVTSTVDAEVPATATRMFVMYRINTSAAVADGLPVTSGTRFDVQIHQRLPFLNFTNTEWAMLIAVRNVFHEDALDASAYDELLVVRPPKRVVGGVTVRF